MSSTPNGEDSANILHLPQSTDAPSTFSNEILLENKQTPSVNTTPVDNTINASSTQTTLTILPTANTTNSATVTGVPSRNPSPKKVVTLNYDETFFYPENNPNSIFNRHHAPIHHDVALMYDSPGNSSGAGSGTGFNQYHVHCPATCDHHSKTTNETTINQIHKEDGFGRKFTSTLKSGVGKIRLISPRTRKPSTAGSTTSGSSTSDSSQNAEIRENRKKLENLFDTEHDYYRDGSVLGFVRYLKERSKSYLCPVNTISNVLILVFIIHTLVCIIATSAILYSA